jgi:metal-responsive CopG/Arc/MetJ family transcriptional regulator
MESKDAFRMIVIVERELADRIDAQRRDGESRSVAVRRMLRRGCEQLEAANAA